MIILLDSTVLIDLTRGATGPNLRELFEGHHTLATSPVNITEVYAGVRPSEVARLERLIADLETYPVSEAIGRRAGILINTWARKGRTLDLPDMVVAATALEHDLTLMTANRRDFPIPELKFYPT